MDSIEKQFQAGIDKAMAIRDKAYMIWLTTFCYKLILSAEENRSYENLTGNTVTSYSCGIYNNKKLVSVIQDRDIPPPVRVKLTEGEIMPKGSMTYGGEPLDFDYEAETKTDQRYGDDTAWWFLSRFKPMYMGYCVVMTTGTEYSIYIHALHRMDVMTVVMHGGLSLFK